MRLSDRGLLESSWENDRPLGRPPRHLYRLTGVGVRLVGELATGAAGVTGRAAGAEARGELRGCVVSGLGCDGAGRLLGLAVWLLPPGRWEWSQAMYAELAAVEPGRSPMGVRWRLS